MAKMTCYVVANHSAGAEVFLDEQKAMDSFFDQLYAWGAQDSRIKKWMHEYNSTKSVVADLSDDMCYFVSLEQTVLNY